MKPRHVALICEHLFDANPAGFYTAWIANELMDRGYRVTVLAMRVGETHLKSSATCEDATLASRVPLLDRLRHRRFVASRCVAQAFDHTISLVSTIAADTMLPVGATRRSKLDALHCETDTAIARWSHRIKRYMPTQRMGLRHENAAFDNSTVRSVIAMSSQIEAAFEDMPCVDANKVVRAAIPIAPTSADDRTSQMRSHLATAFGLDASGTWIVHPFSHDAELDGLQTVIRAFKPLAEGNERAMLLLAGPTRYTHLAWIASLGLRDRVRLIGETTRLRDLVSASDLVVSPARHDPCGWWLRDAVSLKKLAIAGSACGLSQAVRGAGGIILGSPTDPAELLKAMSRCVDSSSDRSEDTDAIEPSSRRSLIETIISSMD